MKLKALAVLACATFALSSVFAHDNACCAGMTDNNMKASCDATFAQLNLTAAQKAKMEKLAAICDKDGCNKQAMAKMEVGARKVLTKEQFTAWKAACSGHTTEKTQS